MEIQDITEDKQVRQALQAADERFDLALNKFTDYFAICDSKWRYLYVNNSYAQNLGKFREQLLGQRIWDIVPQAVGTLNYKNCMKTAEDRIPRTWTSSITFPGRVMEYRTFAWDEGLTLLIRDITKEKKAEEALKSSEEISKHCRNSQ